MKLLSFNSSNNNRRNSSNNKNNIRINKFNLNNQLIKKII